MTVQYLGTGRRKSSVARVRLVPGTGKVIINGREFEDYIPSAATRLANRRGGAQAARNHNRSLQRRTGGYALCRQGQGYT